MTLFLVCECVLCRRDNVQLFCNCRKLAQSQWRCILATKTSVCSILWCKIRDLGVNNIWNMSFYPPVVIHFDNQPSRSVFTIILNVVFNQFVYNDREQQSGLISAIYIPPPKLLPVYFWSDKKESGRYWKMVLVLHFHFHPCVVLTALLILTSSPVVPRIITIPRQAGSRNNLMAVCTGNSVQVSCSHCLVWLELIWENLEQSMYGIFISAPSNGGNGCKVSTLLTLRVAAMKTLVRSISTIHPKSNNFNPIHSFI